MYVTRPLSLFKSNPEAATEPPPPGPGSGYLVVQDEEYQAEATCCFGLCKDTFLGSLPFPQDRRLNVMYTTYQTDGNGGGRSHTDWESVYLIPAIDQPLSSNRYYVVVGSGKHKGKISACSTDDDKVNCCFCKIKKDVKPREFDLKDVYQEVEILPLTGCFGEKGTFYAKSTADDGHASFFLRRKGWRVSGSSSHVNTLSEEASGIDASRRARKPDMGFEGARSPPVVVGRWHSPFLFVREHEMSLREQVEKSFFYEITLEQFWEVVYAGESAGIVPETGGLHLHGGEERASVLDRRAEWVMWSSEARTAAEVGVHNVIWKRMRWEAQRGGWIDRPAEEMAGRGRKCFVLVERFSLRRKTGQLVLTYDFRYVHEVRST